MAAGLFLFRFAAAWHLLAGDPESDSGDCVRESGAIQSHSLSGLRLLPVSVPRHVRLLQQGVTGTKQAPVKIIGYIIAQYRQELKIRSRHLNFLTANQMQFVPSC